MRRVSRAYVHRVIVGWILTLRKLGDIFGVPGFHTWNLVMTVLMCATWVVLFVLTALAFWEGKIFRSPPEDVLRDTLHLRFAEKTRTHERDLEKGEAGPQRTDSPDPMSMPQSETQTLHDVPVSMQQQTFDIHAETPRAM